MLLSDVARVEPAPSQDQARAWRWARDDGGKWSMAPAVSLAIAKRVGANAVILTDPIFQGLAISLLFGLASSTLLTVLVIPAIYTVLRDDDRPVEQAA